MQFRESVFFTTVRRRVKKFNRYSSLPADSSGSAAIEFAAVMPVFLVLTAGIIAFGIYLGTVHSVQQLAADVARATVPGLSTKERQSLAQRFVDTRSQSYPLLRPDKLHLITSETGNQFNVTMQYDASDLPIWVFKGLVPMPSPSIKRSSAVVHGGN